MPKIGLKQKFYIIFCIVILFSIYQIFSDTLIRYYKEEQRFQSHQNNLKTIMQLNHFLFDMQQGLIELKLLRNSPEEHKLLILKKTEKLKQSLTAIMQRISENLEYQPILQALNTMIKNIHILSSEQIIQKYELIYQKLFLQINYLTSYLQNDYMHSHIIKIIHSDIFFVTHHLSMQNNLESLPHFDAIFLQQLDEIDANLINYTLPKELLQQTQITHSKIKQLYRTPNSTDEIIQVTSQLINTYKQLSFRLHKMLSLEVSEKKKQLSNHFNIKLFIEILALIATLVLLYYFYTSMFLYIRKIQNAHKIKSIFLSNMSHELRTPLNAIIGFLNILKESQDKKEREKFIDIIYKSSKQLLYIINDILDFSKIEDAKLKIEKKPFEIKKEFELLTELFSANASSKNITLQTEFNADVPECIISDKFRLKQILSNLISNALKFTPEGGVVKLIVDVVDDQLYIAVEDNGIGISKSAQKNIFKSFLQAKNSTARKYGGTGLGLSISSKLVHLLGSKLKVKSKEFYGSTFYFYLKYKSCQKGSVKEEINENRSSYKGKILLVEDNPTNQFLMQITFTNLKLDVVVANDGNEALQHFKHNQFDIIFMDDNMPNKSGIEATYDIREYEKAHGLMPTAIVALTANTGTVQKRKFINAGMDEYMPKPFDIKRLHQILQKYLT